MRKAEELLCRSVHPDDDIGALGLDEPESRWSYLVFLQVLGKFLDRKAELGEFDYYFYYARDSLLHYAAWALKNEKPYKDVLDKVDIPTETWPAQDIRKCHLFHLAARCSEGKRRDAYAERAAYFYERCLSDLLSFETAYLARPRVLLTVYGGIHRYYLDRGYDAAAEEPFLRRHAYDFGVPQAFEPQHAVVRRHFVRHLSVSWSEAKRVLADQLRKRFSRAGRGGRR